MYVVIYTPFLAVFCAPPLNGTLLIYDNINSQDTNPTEGSVITFQCAPGFSLVGAVTATCNNSGLWDPDPAQLECKLINLVSEPCAYIMAYINYRCDSSNWWEHCCCSWRCYWWSLGGCTDCPGAYTSLSHYHQERKK